MAPGCDDRNARQICVRDRGQDKGNGERKGGMGRSKRTSDSEEGRG